MAENINGKIFGINGPVVTVKGGGFRMSDMVMAGTERLIGEVIGLVGDTVTIQVFEDTSGLRPGEDVASSGKPLTVWLGPGILGNIFDGIQRPLAAMERETGVFVSRGVHMDKLDAEKLWDVTPVAEIGMEAQPGAVFAHVPETGGFIHKAMVPPGVNGKFTYVAPEGKYTIKDPVAKVTDENGQTADLYLAQEWPVRKARPVNRRMPVRKPMITGQRVIDTLFPIGKGGMAAIPGGFGTGKTMTQHQLAKWSDADIIIYIGCGERGNEMTEVLEDFTQLVDPRTGKSLMDRTALIANTSNMPVAAREASIYTGVTIAEYYRDMGYHTAIMADSTSRWAEALRELSGRLEEMPAEEGFPAYLASRLGSFYERAGYVENLNMTEGSVSIIGAVSPQGADFSEPVTQHTKSFVRCFWALDRTLAYARHFPAIQWSSSYSEYIDDLEDWYIKNFGERFLSDRRDILKVLYDESELMEIVKLIGSDVLPDGQRLTLAIAKVIRLGFVQQNAYHNFDAYTPVKKQLEMMEIILRLHDSCRKLLALGIPMNVIREEDIFERITSLKYNVGNDELHKLDGYRDDIDAFYEKLKNYHE